MLAADHRGGTMELRHMEAFIVVAEELNFRRAAERLLMAQPPLSQLIKRMEREVGALLFERTTRQVKLTPAGEVFLAEARRSVRAARSATVAARDVAAGKLGTVRLGFSGPTSYEALVNLTRKFRERRPSVRLEIVGPLYGGEAMRHLERHEIDAGLVRLPVASDARVGIREIISHPIVVALPVGHPLADRTEIRLVDVRDEPVISHPRHRGSGTVTVIHNAFLAQGFSPNVVQEAPDTHTLLSLVGAGVGIGFVPSAADHIKLPGVVLVPVPDIPPVTLVLAWREADANPALRALIALADEVAPDCEGYKKEHSTEGAPRAGNPREG
jgi:DNA-binding transcriptional LysR family regulator